MMIDQISQSSMEKRQEWVVLLQHLVKNFRILLAEIAILELWICNRLTILSIFIFATLAVQAIWMLDYHIEPNIFLDLT